MQIERARILAAGLMRRYGLLQSGWRLLWHKGWRKKGGQCRRGERVMRFSVQVCELSERRGVQELVLHEIAHALTIGGHGLLWQKVAQRIGCSGVVNPGPEQGVIWPSKTGGSVDGIRRSRRDTLHDLKSKGHRLVAEDEEYLWEMQQADEQESREQAERVAGVTLSQEEES